MRCRQLGPTAHNNKWTSLTDRLLTCETGGEFHNIADAVAWRKCRAGVLAVREADAELYGRFFARVTFDGDELRNFPSRRAKLSNMFCPLRRESFLREPEVPQSIRHF